MGYCMSQMESNFTIKKENLERVRDTMRGLGHEFKHIAWVDSQTLRNIETVEDGFQEFGWSVEYDEEGNIFDIYFEAEKIGDEQTLFEAIAPYVENGSYIQMHGEDAAIWRWAFIDGTCEEQYAKITFE